jgi:hypothetical protein
MGESYVRGHAQNVVFFDSRSSDGRRRTTAYSDVKLVVITEGWRHKDRFADADGDSALKSSFGLAKVMLTTATTQTSFLHGSNGACVNHYGVALDIPFSDAVESHFS